MKEICDEYDDKCTEKEDFMPEIDDGKSRSCIDERLKDSVEKVQFTKNDKIQEATDEWEEMLKMQAMKRREDMEETNKNYMVLKWKTSWCLW